ncbi:MAG: tRNA (adenosine(37)-N6)-threonylcarbamoyltransferase complex dimerization subunit type 1 TsaB [Holosporaceae bacterium]|nr:tRNA (adenosine(37)-N6)-threonylcarbamoyltransferase complex dimerization subunit type 1 TsaB [Holosporaceae bacterium]
MKNVLAVSACLKRCSVAISYEGNIYEVNEHIDAAANLVWLANNLIKSYDIDLRKINGIIAASGPGSFTGTRVAQSFAKGLALSLRLPSVSVSYFDVIRKIYAQQSNTNVVVIKSEKNQVYYHINDYNYGISSYESLEDKIPDDATLIGDAIDASPNIVYITDFREAKNLLHFSHLISRESKISPLYIAHHNQYIINAQ